MNIFARVVFHMDACNAHALDAPVHVYFKVAVLADGQLELRNLVARGQVGIKIVFTRKNGACIDGAIGGQANQGGKMNGLPIGNRQCAGHARAHFANIGVGGLPKCCGAGTEQFGGRGKLHMHFKANHGFIGGHRSNYSLSGVQPRNCAAKVPLCA